MTKALSGRGVAQKIAELFPEAVVEASEVAVVLKGDWLLQVAQHLKAAPDFNFDYLTNITGVDYLDYFEVVYQLTSLEHNHSLVLKVRCYDRQSPVLPSVVVLWQGAELQEREIYDLLGIAFDGHPNLKRIFLWEGFPGHPLRKDFFY